MLVFTKRQVQKFYKQSEFKSISTSKLLESERKSNIIKCKIDTLDIEFVYL